MKAFGKMHWITFTKNWVCIGVLMAGIIGLPHRASADIATSYTDLAQQLLETTDFGVFDFAGLRSFYSQSEYYDPLAEETLQTLQGLVDEIAITTDDPKKTTALFMAYNQLVGQHLANFDVIEFALGLAVDDGRFGNPDYFRWIMRGLTDSIVANQDGLSVARAYRIITLGEEQAVFDAIDFKVTSKNIQHSGYMYYGIYDGIHTLNGAKEIVFVDLSVPLKFLYAQNKKTPPPF